MKVEEIKNQAEQLLKFGKKKADYVLINVSKSINEDLEIRSNNIDGFDYSDSCNYLVNVWKDGKKGVAFSNKFSLDLVSKALKIAKSSKKLSYFYGLPSKKKLMYPKNYDKKINDLNEETLVDIGKDLIKNTVEKNIIVSKAGVNKDLSFDILLNSEGVNVNEKSTSFSVFVCATGKSGQNVSTSWQSKHENFYFNYDNLMINAKKECLDFLKAKKLSHKVKNVILKPEPFTNLLVSTLLVNFNAKNIEKNQSCLIGKLGEQIFDKSFSLNDDGLLKKGVHSSAVDFQGAVHKNTKLVDNGVVKSFVYDYNTAKKFDVENTGNASASGINFTNVVLNGKHNKVSDGLIVGSVIGAHTANPMTTDFSVKAENCYYLDGGVKVPVKGVMISGRMLDVLSDIVSVGKKKEQKGGIYTGALVSDKVNVIR
tara:strand:+ start:18833 stop:20110 length:1278 start_codon:yes stop_codon:yes gene_type:complete